MQKLRNKHFWYLKNNFDRNLKIHLIIKWLPLSKQTKWSLMKFLTLVKLILFIISTWET